jgi:RNA polymerase sigma factor (sigma-70 family)
MIRPVACFSRLMRVCRRRGRSPEDAEDLIQDALLRLHEFRRNAQGTPQPAIRNDEAWLTRTVSNLAINQYRREQLLTLEPTPVEELEGSLAIADPAPGPDDVLDSEQHLAEIKRILGTVSERARDICLLSMQGYPQAEIAQAYHVSLSTVQKDLIKAVAALVKRCPSR